MRLFVAGFNRDVTNKDLKRIFSRYAVVRRVKIWIDLKTGESKGFGFVEMSSEAEAKEAIKQLNNKELDGRSIVVNEARPKEDRPQRFNGAPHRY